MAIARDSSTSITQIYFERFLTKWQDSNGIPPRWLALVFFSGLAAICGAAVLTGAVPTRIFGHDIFFQLDNGWRAINGQRPHLDYYSPWGPVMFLVSALGLTISRHSVDGVGYGNAIVALIVGTWSFFLAKNRLVSSPRILLSFILAALVTAPYVLGGSPFTSSHAMVYNRYGYALVGLVLMETMKAPRFRGGELAGGISTGAALGLALFLKASYFLVGVILLAAISLLLDRVGVRRILAVLLGFSFVSVCMLAYLRFDVAAMLGDLRMAAGARAAILTLDVPVRHALNHGTVFLAVILFSFAAALTMGERGALSRGLPVIGALIFAADIGLISSNAQSDGFPLCAVFALLVANEITEDQQLLAGAEAGILRPSYGAALCLGALLFLPLFIGDLAGLGYGFWKKQRPSTPAEVLRFTAPQLKPLLLYDGADQKSANGRIYTTYVNDGVALLERETRADETVLTMDMSNPFPYALGRRPPRAGVAAMTYYFTMNDEHRPSDGRYFGDADIVMVPKRPAEAPIFYTDFLNAYEPGLHERYKLAAETDWWWMYRRK
jgi:hypothetical protein